jgi:acyl-CoA thioester hydrolase
MSGRSETTLRVRYAETDQMGVAYHANYLVWCEVGRTDFIRGLGLPYAELERRGTFLAVADASIRYRAPARYDDLLRVATRVESAGSRAITFGYEISRIEPDPVLLATARTTLVSLDGRGGTRKLPPDLLGLFRQGGP